MLELSIAAHIIRKKERIVGKKETCKEGEGVKLQDIKTKIWNTEGVVIGVRTANEGTFVSYCIEVEGCVKTCHRKYMSKIRNAAEEIEDSGNTRAENTARAESKAGSQQ